MDFASGNVCQRAEKVREGKVGGLWLGFANPLLATPVLTIPTLDLHNGKCFSNTNVLEWYEISVLVYI